MRNKIQRSSDYDKKFMPIEFCIRVMLLIVILLRLNYEFTKSS